MTGWNGRRVRVTIAVGLATLAVVGAVLFLSRSHDGQEPHGGLPEVAAIEAARARTSGQATGVISAEMRPDFPSTPLEYPVAAHPWAWVVTFRGSWELLCDASSDPCHVSSEWVAIDYYTGAWIASQYAYPAGR